MSLRALATSKTEDIVTPLVTGNEKVGVLLLNLGGPETLKDVQPFLFNLFADPVNLSIYSVSTVCDLYWQIFSMTLVLTLNLSFYTDTPALSDGRVRECWCWMNKPINIL